MTAIAAIFAHPDDETFAVAGTIVRYRAEGVPTHLFCATDGDAGRSSGVAVSSRAELGRLRRTELEAAARILGIASVRSVGHPDGGLPGVDADELIGQVVAFVREHRPTLVLTFGPEGAPTGHRDHRAISRAATTAFFLSGLATAYPEQVAAGLAPHAAARLYYVSWDPPAPGARLPTLAVPLTARIDVRGQLATKEAAFFAHRTQRDHEAHFRELALGAEEPYALAAGVPQPGPVVDDLFAGL